MKKIFLIQLLLMTVMHLFAQQKNFDIISYTPPKDWTETLGEGNISYSRIDGGSWAQIAIYAHRNSEGDIQTDFDKDWNELVATGKSISSPEKTEPKSEGGWSVMSGSGVWKYNGSNVASMLTVYSNNKVCVAVLCNSTAMPYLKDYQAMISTLDIDAGSANTQQPATGNTQSADNSIVGLWTNYILETTGYSMNGGPQYTAGYLRKEYNFYADSTYLFRNKQWLVKAPNIVFQYETGTYTVNGNQLTLSPNTGKGGFWKKTKSTKEWGSLIKSSTYNLEKTTYTFEIIIDKTYGNSIVLKSSKPTQRDGGQFNAPNDPFEFHYRFRELESSIDNPPGFKP